MKYLRIVGGLALWGLFLSCVGVLFCGTEPDPDPDKPGPVDPSPVAAEPEPVVAPALWPAAPFDYDALARSAESRDFDPHRAHFPATGEILDCPFLQAFERNGEHFTTGMTNTHDRTLIFDDSSCRPDHLGPYEYTLIDTIQRWYKGSYFNAGVYFDPRGERLADMLQARGFCIRGQTAIRGKFLPSAAIRLDFLIEGEKVVAVKHARGIQCNPGNELRARVMPSPNLARLPARRAEALEAEFMATPAAARQKYRGQRLHVAGTVLGREGSADGGALHLEGSSSGSFVTARFDDYGKLDQVVNGQRVRVLCERHEYSDFRGLELQECEVQE